MTIPLAGTYKCDEIINLSSSFFATYHLNSIRVCTAHRAWKIDKKTDDSARSFFTLLHIHTYYLSQVFHNIDMSAYSRLKGEMYTHTNLMCKSFGGVFCQVNACGSFVVPFFLPFLRVGGSEAVRAKSRNGVFVLRRARLLFPFSVCMCVGLCLPRVFFCL